MKVYRCCSNEEVESYNKNEIYHSYYKGYGSNTFDYEDDVDYIHFFYYPECSLNYAKHRPFMIDKIIICNMDEELLKKHLGYGYYDGVCRGKYIPFPEFAIPLSEFSVDYIEKIINVNEINEYFNKSGYDKYLEMLPEEYKENSLGCYFKEGYHRYSVNDMPSDYIFKKGIVRTLLKK